MTLWIKICGIRDVETAQSIARLGADAIGLNFFARSPRAVDGATAAEIVRALPAVVEPIGLFVNHSLDDIRRLADQSGVRTLQLHGDEPPELLAQLAGYKLLRAFRVGEEGLSAVADYLAACRSLGVALAGCLLDARVEGQFGGTGKVAPWQLIRDQYEVCWPPLILAGGLSARNIADAVQQVAPWGVDVAGGVESSPGVKDINQIRNFVAAARHASDPPTGGSGWSGVQP